MEWVLKWSVHEMHLWLAEDIDKQKLEASLRKNKK